MSTKPDPSENISPEAITKIGEMIKKELPKDCEFCVLFYTSGGKPKPIQYASSSPTEVVLRLFASLAQKYGGKR